MLALRSLALLLLSMQGFALAATQRNINDIPTCALICIAQSLSQTPCSPTDTACLCADTKFAAAVSPCIASKCTIKESLVATNATWAECGLPYKDDTGVLYWTGGVVTVIAVVFMIMRLINKAIKLSKWGTDDTIIVVTFAFVVALYIEIFFFIKAGLGRSVWTLTPDDITYFLKILIIFEYFYVVGLAAIKASILFFFLRIFPGRRFRKALWVVQLMNMLIALAFLITLSTQCQPFSYSWNSWDGEHEGKCVKLNITALIHVSLNIGLDVAMLILPVTQVYKLQMNLKKKAGVIAMLLMGVFLTIVSVLRVKSLSDLTWSYDFTYDTVDVIIWAYVELGVGIMVACMPPVWQLMKMIPAGMANMSAPLATNLSMAKNRTVVESEMELKTSTKASVEMATIRSDSTATQPFSTA